MPNLAFSVDMPNVPLLTLDIAVGLDIIDGLQLPDYSMLWKIFDLLGEIHGKICSAFFGFCDVLAVFSSPLSVIEDFVKDLIRQINPNLDLSAMFTNLLGNPFDVVDLNFWNVNILPKIDLLPNVDFPNLDLSVTNFITSIFNLNLPIPAFNLGLFQCETGAAGTTLHFEYSCEGADYCNALDFTQQQLTCPAGYRVNVFTGLHFEQHNASFFDEEYGCKIPIDVECDSDIAIQCTGQNSCVYTPANSISQNTFKNCNAETKTVSHFVTVYACKDELYWNDGLGVSIVAQSWTDNDWTKKYIFPLQIENISPATPNTISCKDGFHIVFGGIYGNAHLYPEELRKLCMYKQNCSFSWEVLADFDFYEVFPDKTHWLDGANYCPTQWMYDRNYDDNGAIEYFWCTGACGSYSCDCPPIPNCDPSDAPCCVRRQKSGWMGSGNWSLPYSSHEFFYDHSQGLIKGLLKPFGYRSATSTQRTLYYRCVSSETVTPIGVQMKAKNNEFTHFAPDWPRSSYDLDTWSDGYSMLPAENILSCKENSVIRIRSATFQKIDNFYDYDIGNFEARGLSDVTPFYNATGKYRELLSDMCNGKQTCAIDFPMAEISTYSWIVYAYDCLCASGFQYDEVLKTCVMCPFPLVSGGNNKMCRLCPSGSFPNEDQTSCLKCPAGSHKPPEEHPEYGCTLCSAGEYQDLEDQDTCKLCPLGTYQDSDGGVTCIDCPEGTYSGVEGGVLCEPAGEGYYVPGTGSDSQIPCPPFYNTSIPGQTTCTSIGILECIGECEEEGDEPARCGDLRLYYNGSTCVQCPANKIADSLKLSCVDMPTAYPTPLPTAPTMDPTPDPTPYPTSSYPTPEPTAGLINIALRSNGGVAFGSGSLPGYCSSANAGIGESVTGIHCYSNINDGIYGNGNSWIPNQNMACCPYAGIIFSRSATIEFISTSRDRTGSYTDRTVDTFTLKASKKINPGYSTSSALTWEHVKTFTRYSPLEDVQMLDAPYTSATGVKLEQGSFTTCTDELEVWGIYDYFHPHINVAAHSYGSVAFASSSFPSLCSYSGPGVNQHGQISGIHCYTNINDGKLDNSYSWIPDPGLPGPHFVGIRFPSNMTIYGLRTSRGEAYNDRFQDTFTVYVTADPLAGHVTPMSVYTHVVTFERTTNLLQYVQFPQPVTAHAIRIEQLNGNSCTDELQVYGHPAN
mmetsp:Transcript_13529/g.20309  ORF Transcript_13529/g.20309 Transcript_13529/m.20309 type:complete len:1189 (-) Transcript_13529:14-3580(-)